MAGRTDDVGAEFHHVLARRPRSILIKLAISLGLGLAYLGFVRLSQWESYSELMPYLAIYAFFGVIGGVVCTGALPAADSAGGQPGRPARIRRVLLREMVEYKSLALTKS